VTYQDQRVQDLLDEETAPVQVDFKESRELRERYDVAWTPTLVLLDAAGEPHQKLVPASLPPDDFLPVVRTAIGRFKWATKDYDAAIRAFDDVLARHPDALAAPEALYWRGVALYGKHAEEAMKRSWAELGERFPKSYWAKATTFVREKR
jgi:tetratricopeptide (TPR) repeat protein